MWQIRQVLLLIFAAVVLATALDRPVQQFQRLKIKRDIAIAITIGILLAIIAGFFILIVPSFVEQLQKLVKLVPKGFDRVQNWIEWLQETISQQPVGDLGNLRGLTQQLQSFLSGLFDNFFTFFSNSIGIIVSSLFVLILTIMLLAQPTPYRQGFILLVPSFYRRRVDDILNQCKKALGGWAIGILFNMSAIAVLSWIGLSLLGVPLPLANAVLAGVLTFIPNIGPTISVIPPMALALSDAFWKAGAVVLLYVAIQQIESNILTPFVMQKQVSLLPAVTLASQVIFASVFGFLGLFLALPLAIVLQIVVKELLVRDIFNKWQQPAFAKSKPNSTEDSDAIAQK